MAIHDTQALVSQQSQHMRRSVALALLCALGLWCVKLVEFLFGLDLSVYGVFPRQLSGLVGVIFGPLIHGSFSHLLANTLPVLVLLTLLMYGYKRSTRIVVPVLYFGVGVLVWLFARESYHIGASGFTFGLMFFLFVVGILRRDKQSIALSLVVFFLYGGMLGGLYSEDAGISFESHMAGAVIGVVLAFILRQHDPAPPPKRYSWEGEDDFTESDSGLEIKDRQSTIIEQPHDNRTIH